MWAFAVSPWGLALSDADFWGITPRTYCYLRARWRESRMFGMAMYAQIQATLHNAHFRHERSDPMFTGEMFLPGYKPQQQSWQQQKEMLAQRAQRKPMTPEQLRKIQEGSDIYRDRAKRAREAQERGESPEKVRALMEGVQ